MARGDFIVRTRPRSYLLTSQQVKIKEVCERCGVHKGMSRAELIKAMTECVPGAYKELRGSEEQGNNLI